MSVNVGATISNPVALTPSTQSLILIAGTHAVTATVNTPTDVTPPTVPALVLTNYSVQVNNNVIVGSTLETLTLSSYNNPITYTPVQGDITVDVESGTLTLTAQNVTSIEGTVDVPPVINSTPSPSFVNGTGSTYSLANFVTDDGATALTYVINGTLPGTVTLAASTGILTYTETGGDDTTFANVTFTVSDAGNQATSSSFNITIQEASGGWASPADNSTIFGWMWAGDGAENISNYEILSGGRQHYRNCTNLASPGTNDFFNNNPTGTADGYLPCTQSVSYSSTGYSTSYQPLAVHSYNPGGVAVYGQHMFQAPMGAAGEFYLAAVIHSTRHAGERWMWGTDSNNYVLINQETDSGNQCFKIKIAGGSVVQLTPSGTSSFSRYDAMIVEIWRDSSDGLHCRINGADKTLGSPSASGTFNMNGWGGRDGDTSAGWDDVLFELVCCNGATTPTERDNTKSYLNARWATYDPLTLPLVPASASLFTYQGAFELPDADVEYSPGNFRDMWNGMPQLGAMCYNPANDSLFIVGRGDDSEESMAEVSIPTPKSSAYNTATFLAGPALACGGNQGLVESGENGNACAGIQIHNGRLIIFVVARYQNEQDINESSGPTTSCCFTHDSLDIDASNVTGPYTLGPYSATQLESSHPLCNRIYGGSGGDLSVQWQGVFGSYKSWMGGGGAQSIVGHHTSNGPQYVFFNPDSITGSTSTNKDIMTHAVEYEDANTLGVFQGPFTETITGMSTWKASYFSENYRTAVTYGRHGDMDYRGDLTPNGNYAVVQVSDRFWFHDIQDIKNSFDGITAVDASTPYATLDLDFCVNNSNIPLQESYKRAACFDTVNKRLFVCEGKAGSSFPLVHVLSVNF